MFISVGIIHGEAQLAEQTISQGFVIWGKKERKSCWKRSPRFSGPSEW